MDAHDRRPRSTPTIDAHDRRRGLVVFPNAILQRHGDEMLTALPPELFESFGLSAWNSARLTAPLPPALPRKREGVSLEILARDLLTEPVPVVTCSPSRFAANLRRHLGERHENVAVAPIRDGIEPWLADLEKGLVGYCTDSPWRIVRAYHATR